MYFVTIVTYAFIPLVTPFVLNDFSCPANSPCTCTDLTIIDCTNKDLTMVAEFNKTGRYSHLIDLHFGSNRVEAIPAGAFMNLGHSEVHELLLGFDGNEISRLDENAFAGVETIVKVINLEYNKMTHLPHALMHLTQLTDLELAGNPMVTFDSAIMHHIGKTMLRHFSFGTATNQWPDSFSQLRHLQRLDIDKSEIDNIPSGQHLGNLITLNLGETNLESIPDQVCHLHALQTISFNTTEVYDTDNIFPNCGHHARDNVQMLTLSGNNLFEFPNGMFVTFPQLRTLRLVEVPNLSNIDNAHFPPNCSVREFDLSSNNLVTIPAQIANLPNLVTLNMENNPITCSCLMKWMRTWKRRSQVTIKGQCSNYQQSIQDFVRNSLDIYC